MLDLEEMPHHADSIDTGNDERNNILFISIRVQKGLTSSSILLIYEAIIFEIEYEYVHVMYKKYTVRLIHKISNNLENMLGWAGWGSLPCLQIGSAFVSSFFSFLLRSPAI